MKSVTIFLVGLTAIHASAAPVPEQEVPVKYSEECNIIIDLLNLPPVPLASLSTIYMP